MMAERQTGPEQEGFYDILQNGAGDLLISIRARAGEPDHPQIVYDGGKHALLYRQHGFSMPAAIRFQRGKSCKGSGRRIRQTSFFSTPPVQIQV